MKRNYNDKIIITMQELMEQMDISDKTLHRMIDEGDLPDFTYGSKWSKKKGWHSVVLERHALEKYEKSQSLKNACDIGKVRTEDMGIMFLGGSNGSMSQKHTNLDDRDSGKQQSGSEKVSKRMRSSSGNSRVAAGF